MDSDAIFLVRGDTLVPLVNRPYASEAKLQDFVARFPELIAGGQIDPDEPRRWVLVGREVGVPDREDGHDRWSLDHLILDQDAVPTVVEVKRSTDTRIRREVVGQMLDYAANGTLYWPVKELKAHFESNHAHPEEVVAEVTDGMFGYDGFWDEVEQNLKRRRIRLVWVADVVPTELRTIIEYLNEELTNAEAFAVEIRQYVGSGIETLVPSVLGMSATQRVKRQEKRSSSFAENLERSSPATKELVSRLLELGHGGEYLVKETRTGLRVRFADSGASALMVYPQYNSVEFSLESIRDAGLDAKADAIAEFLARVSGRQVPSRRPAVAADALIRSWDEFVGEVMPAYQEAKARARRTAETPEGAM